VPNAIPKKRPRAKLTRKAAPRRRAAAAVVKARATTPSSRSKPPPPHRGGDAAPVRATTAQKPPAATSSAPQEVQPRIVNNRRKPGRKAGSSLSVLAKPLQPHELKLLHAVIQGLDLKVAYAHYARDAHDEDGDRNDRRHLASEVRDIVARVGRCATGRGHEALAQQALDGLGRPQGVAGNATALARPSGAGAAAARRRQVGALARMAEALKAPPAPSDGLEAFLEEALAARLRRARMDGKEMPLVSLANLVDYINLQGHRWWRTVPGLGDERAGRILEWLTPVAQEMNRPLHERALHKQAMQRIKRENQLALVSPTGQCDFGLVELGRLAVPEALDGRQGVFRSADANTMGARTDIEAIAVWLKRFEERPRTQRLYTQVVERFYLWCLLARRKPMSSLDEQDMMAFKDFLRDPPADWVQERQTPRGSNDWRPLRGALSAATTKLNMSIVASLFAELQKAGYLRAQAAGAVKSSMKLPHMTVNTRRSFTNAQWAHVMACWGEQYAAEGPAMQDATANVTLPRAGNEDRNPYRAALLRRTRLLLELGASTGLRLSEMVTTRRSAMEVMSVDGQEVTILNVIGKGNKPREVVLFDDVRLLIKQHHDDMDARDTAFEPDTHAVRSLHGAQADLEKAKPSPAHLPIIGALRKPPRTWRRDKRGVAQLEGGQLADRFGALDPSALYQGLKRFLAKCADVAAERGDEEMAQGLRRASTHWLRHYFANSAVADEVQLAALREAMGHASLTTTSVYVRTETQQMIREMGKLRRK
jgi:integrase